MAEFILLSQLIQNFAIGLAVIIGGLWALYIFVSQRTYETALRIRTSVSHTLLANRRSIVYIDTVLRNMGSRRIGAKAKRYKNGVGLPAYSDELDKLYHSCGVQIKRLNLNIPGHVAYDWYQPELFVPIDGIPSELNLLAGYVTSKKGEVDFWLEPRETYHIGIALTLPLGSYLGRVVFIGDRGVFEYWSHDFFFSVHGDESSAT